MFKSDELKVVVAEINRTFRLDLKSKEALTLLDHSRLKQRLRDTSPTFEQDINRALVLLYKAETFLQGDKDFLVKYKLFNDPIYGNIEVHPVALAIIDTPQFQRLRHIRQLATLSYVYPGANGTRFDHSLGVYHLAGELVNSLRTKQPELGITKVDCLCVQLAGLCHDLGHGPFSHMFSKVVESLNSEGNWTHVDTSLKMVDYIFDPSVSSAREVFGFWGLENKDLEFIKSLIKCEPNENAGRDDSKSFLYEIVANNLNGMDVEKWDYTIRDAMYLGVKINFEYQRLLYHLRVIQVEGKPRICVRDKEVNSLFKLFSTRYYLHEIAYQHKVGRSIELMISDAIVKAAPHLTFNGKTILDCMDDMESYTKLNDGIFYRILDSEDGQLDESRKILERIQNRKLYKWVAGDKLVGSSRRQALSEDIVRELGENFVVEYSTSDFGKEEENPLDFIRYYKKDNPNCALPFSPDQKTLLTPNRFRDVMISIFSKSEDVTDADRERAKDVLKK